MGEIIETKVVGGNVSEGANVGETFWGSGCCMGNCFSDASSRVGGRMSLGANVGALEGETVGEGVGKNVGCLVGEGEGEDVGFFFFSSFSSSYTHCRPWDSRKRDRSPCFVLSSGVLDLLLPTHSLSLACP